MRTLILILLTAILAGPREAESCGPFLSFAQFSYVAQPPQDVFARGQLGILRPKFYRRYLVVAYRYLSGVPLSSEERSAFDTRRMPMLVASAPPSPINQWLEERSRVPGVPAVQRIDQYRALPDSPAESYENCLDDAFLRAAQTLRQRTATWGAHSPLLLDWVRGQDAVFRNCAGGKETPPDPPQEADALLRADRRYQSAAANFYSEQYEAAEANFRAIATEANSPWRDVGELMVARTLIREATVGKDAKKLTEAERVLDGIVEDSRPKPFRTAAEGLREFVRAQIDPDRQLQVLGERLMHRQPGPQFARTLSDFTVLWDKRQSAPAGDSELIDWIATLQASNWKHALERWRDQPENAWLIAALSSVPHDNPGVPQLLAAARQVAPADPAWASAAYYGISLELARGEREEARKWADEALAAKAPADVQNEFLAQRLALAKNWEEFLRYGPRTPVALGGDLGHDDPLENSGPAYESRKRLFDSDFTAPFNFETPLDRWVDATSNAALPAELQAEIARVGWIRAAILDRQEEARSLADRWAALRPEGRALLRDWQAEKDPKAARFQAVLIMLRNPGMQPVIREKFGRTTPIDRIDEFRDNWWDLSGVPGIPAGVSGFLPSPERAAGRKEWQQLQAAALKAPDFLCGETVAWARSHPEDPRVPEALHLAVRTTRYTNGPHTTDFPKQAFTLLHAKYPKSKWAAMTPYWY